MRNITRTVYGSALQTALYLKSTYEAAVNSTLNEKFGILSGEPYPVGTVPGVGYLCIGNRGHKVLGDGDDIPYTSPVAHSATDAALYNHTPFILRTLDNDLTIAERELYALRKIITVDTVSYIAYYLRRFNASSAIVNMSKTNITDGNPTVTPFTPTNENLNPIHPLTPNTGVITTDGTYVAASSILNIEFTEQQIAELVDVSSILYSTPEKAIISEIGLVAAVDMVTSTDDGAGSFNYKEAVGAQVVTHISGYYPVGFTNKGFNIQIEAGATEPLLGENLV